MIILFPTYQITHTYITLTVVAVAVANTPRGHIFYAIFIFHFAIITIIHIIALSFKLK